MYQSLLQLLKNKLFHTLCVCALLDTKLLKESKDSYKKSSAEMRIIMTNFNKVNVTLDARTELHDKLSLTGAEISINNLPAGGSVPFIHAHKKNEEIYAILSGKGEAIIDGETVELTAGDWIRISPAAKRQFFAAQDTAISFVCIQVKENSLEEYTKDDAVV